MAAAGQLVLGSRSPRRLELLRLIVPAERIAVMPPQNSDENGFDDVRDWRDIEWRLAGIARAKADDVLEQCEPSSTGGVIAADTVIVAANEANEPVVLGQPPDDDWRNVVREWFRRYLLGREHVAATAACVATPTDRREWIVQTRVRFGDCDDALLEWYIRSGEPRGKAGGYAIQGAGEMFVAEVSGSLSNVVGLPLRETREALQELGLVERD